MRTDAERARWIRVAVSKEFIDHVREAKTLALISAFIEGKDLDDVLAIIHGDFAGLTFLDQLKTRADIDSMMESGE
jgi:hypothetical protein